VNGVVAASGGTLSLQPPELVGEPA
jgi:hypothetical protein